MGCFWICIQNRPKSVGGLANWGVTGGGDGGVGVLGWVWGGLDWGVGLGGWESGG